MYTVAIRKPEIVDRRETGPTDARKAEDTDVGEGTSGNTGE